MPSSSTRYESPSPTCRDLDCPPQVAKPCRRSLLLAIQQDNFAEAQNALDQDPTAAVVLLHRGNSALAEACASGCSPAMLELLLRHGAYPDERPKTMAVAPLAALAGAPAEDLQPSSTLPFIEMEDLFGFRDTLGKVACEQLLASWHLPLGAGTSLGFGAMTKPVASAQLLSSARLLLAAGANPERLDSSGRTAACWARGSGMPELAALLKAARELRTVAFLNRVWHRSGMKLGAPCLLALPGPARGLLCQHLAPELPPWPVQ